MRPTVKPFTTLTVALLLVMAVGHFLRLINDWPVTIGGWAVPFWVSVVGLVVPAILAFLVWRENR